MFSTVVWPATRGSPAQFSRTGAQCACSVVVLPSLKLLCYVINKSIRNVGGQCVTAAKKDPNTATKYITPIVL